MAFVTWKDVVDRYPAIATKGSSKSVESSYLYFAENQVNGMFAENFTVPFSSNNITAKDLAIDVTYLRIGIPNVTDTEKLMKMLDHRVKMLNNGTYKMMLDDGTSLVTLGDVVYSSDADFHKTFGHGDVEDFFPDSSQIYDEDQERNI